MFVVGVSGDDVNEYTLSTGFDVNPPDPTTNKDVIGLIDAQVQGAKRLAEQTTNTILDRITHVRSQDPMGETSQQDIKVSFTNPDLTLASSLVTMPKMPNLNPFQGFQTEEWSTWTKADITIGKIGDTSLSSVQDISIQGVSIGADRKVDNDKVYGLSMRFANNDTDIGNAGTNISTQSVNLSVYGSRYLDNDTFVDGVIGAGYMQSDVARKNGSNTLNGDREGNQIFGSLKFGKKIKQSQFNIAPYGKIHSSYTHLKGYSETGTNALKFDALEIGAISNSLGLEIDRSIQYQKSSVKPRFIIEYGKEIGSDESTQDMYYANDTSTKYSYTSDQKDRDVMTTGIGFDFVHDNGLTLSTDYERKQNGDNDYFDSVFIAANFLSRKESQYSLSFQGSDGDLVSQLEASKRLGLFDITAQLENDFTSANHQLSLSASHNF
jgi:outer membrane autotransporter protein